MKKIILLIIFGLSTSLYSQCADYNDVNLCNNNNDCEWIENINNYSCSGFSQNQCYQYEGCDWTLSYGGYYGQWSHTCSGSYQIDNSYCQEVEMPECSEMDESECIDNNNCGWIENVTYGNCAGLSEYACDSNPDCFFDCEFYHGSCAGCCYGSCLGGTYEIDNSYCEENEYIIDDCSQLDNLGDCNHSANFNLDCEWINDECQEINEEHLCDLLTEVECQNNQNCHWSENEIIEDCDELNSETQCESYPGECFWDEDINYNACSEFSNQNECAQYDGCVWDCSWWYTWACWCIGSWETNESECLGEYISEEGICEESEYQLGDLNGDFEINILDIIEMIDLILNNNYNSLADINNDNNVNITDVITIINIILNND